MPGLPLITGLIAALAYLLNFNVVNAQLAGYVDSSEAFLMICLILVLQRQSWNVLTLLGPIGVLGKETFAPIAAFFAYGLILVLQRQSWNVLTCVALAREEEAIVPDRYHGSRYRWDGCRGSIGNRRALGYSV
jgi:hypothetical protein